MEKAELHSDLVWLAKRQSYDVIFELLYTLGQARYATFKQLHPINYRIFTKNNLKHLVSLGYLAESNLTNYHLTDKSIDLLKKKGFNTKVLQTKFSGDSLIHTSLIADVVLKLQDQDNFYQVFYPTFTKPPEWKDEFLRPDFCAVWRKDNSYKIQFGEVEQPKDDWERYLLKKKEKYEILSRADEIFSLWWKAWSERLKLPMCKREDFCFSVAVYSHKDFNLGEGFIFEH